MQGWVMTFYNIFLFYMVVLVFFVEILYNIQKSREGFECI